MKIFIKGSMLLLLLAINYHSKAQQRNPRPKLFSEVQNRINYPKTELEKIFVKAKGSKYQISLPGNFRFTGTVVSVVNRYDNLQSLLIKSEVLNGAIFAVSKRINDDKTISYSGRLINEKYSDGYELKTDANGNYFLDKINMDELLPDR